MGTLIGIGNSVNHGIGGVSGPYSANSTSIDGISDYFLLSSQPTGAAQSKLATISFWLKRTTTGTEAILYNTSRNSIRFVGTGLSSQFRWTMKNSVGTTILDLKTADTVFNDTSWHHIILSYDLASGYHIYVDGVIESVTEATATINDSVDWEEDALAVGATTVGGSLFPGCISELYLALEYIDLSVAANLAKFISDGIPVSLGSDGSTPTGTAPMVYLKGNGAAFGTDSSGNGNTLTAIGSSSACSTSPAL